MKLATGSRNAEADAWAGQMDGGSIDIYDGTIPTDPQTAIGSQNLLISFDLAATAFGSAAAGVATANTTTVQTITATGTAAWARLFKSDGTTVVADVTVGTTGTDIIVATTSFVLDDAVNLTSGTYTQNE